MQYAQTATNDHDHHPVERYVADVLETLNDMPGEMRVAIPTLPKLSELGATPEKVAQVNRYLAPYGLTMARIYSVVSKMYLGYGKLNAEHREMRKVVLARLERMLLNPDFQNDMKKLLEINRAPDDEESLTALRGSFLLMGSLRAISMSQGEIELYSTLTNLYLMSGGALALAIVGICLAIWLPRAK